MKQVGLAVASYADRFRVYPPGGMANIAADRHGAADHWRSEGSLNWRALVVPQMENGNAFNSVKLVISSNTTSYGPEFSRSDMYTAYSLTFGSWLCPSDATNGDGRLPNGEYDIGNPRGQFCAQVLDLRTGRATTWTPVSNYQGSFGDNYCGGRLVAPDGLVWETAWDVPLSPGVPRVGYNGFWGTSLGPPDGWTPGTGFLRGMFDFGGTQRPPSIRSVTDGTSNTVIVGEVIPSQCADCNFWFQNGGVAGMTVPLNWNSNTVDPSAPDCVGNWHSPKTPLGCRFGAASKGFASQHPGGANFAFADGSVHFIKASISMATYVALGSRNGGDVVSADVY
jgi:prepilin-type processing-associated H-X9-DG protein